jgi:hypothetical protein
MYAPQPSPQDDPAWPTSPPAQSEETWRAPGIPVPPTYLPPAVPPRFAYSGATRRIQALLRIPGERPVLTLVLLAVLVAIFLIMTLAGRSINATENNQFLVAWGAKVNFLVVRGEW